MHKESSCWADPKNGFATRSLFALAIAFGLALPTMSHADESAESLVDEARALYRGSDTPPEDLRTIRTLLDRVIEYHPGSDLAVNILLGQVDGLDIAAIDAGIAAPSSSTTSSPDHNVAPTVERDAGNAPDAIALQADGSDDDVAGCVAGAINGVPVAAISVGAVLGQAGQITGLPELVNPENPGPEARGMFLAVAGALDACSPFPMLYADERVLVVVDDAGFVEIGIMAPKSEEQAGDEAAMPSPAALPSPGTEETEAALALNRGDVRDLQTRLLVLGFDPNGVDGLTGRGTRAAINAWQSASGIAATGYLNADQLALLKQESDAPLSEWLENPENAALYSPPVIALGPSNMSGTWRFRSNCGPSSRLGQITITGDLSISHAGGNRYTGQARQTQGFRGRFSGQLSGRTVTGEINWGLIVGQTQFRGVVDDSQLVLRGTDSNRCAFFAQKT